ncbi:MAG: pentapeptide repeat-containing protein [Candidatus Aenigmarchaeota archaeon]|nr:pentapeptide repeat-containing protein [Candidatus Aenigmarchaeota archaeon]
MRNQIIITGSEWMKKLFEGERDFSRTKIVGEPVVLQHIKEINDYLTMANLEREPLILDLADISGVRAPELYAPHTKARGIRAPYADFGRAFLSYSDFGPYRNPNGSETRSNMVYVTFDNATMNSVVLRGAVVRGISLRYADLSGSDLTGVRDLETSPNAGLAIYHNITADDAVKKIISRKIGLDNRV